MSETAQETFSMNMSPNFEYDPDGYHYGVPKGVSLQHAIVRLKQIDMENYYSFLGQLDSNQIVRKNLDGNPIDVRCAGQITLSDVFYELNIDFIILKI